ncbi:MAG TPA: hypothetical protein ENG36_03245, partial [Lentisphaerae bacterium]|nr:hypothetical protein [Lentisphaerota bacterium]
MNVRTSVVGLTLLTATFRPIARSETYSVTSGVDGAIGSLRWAVECSHTNPGRDRVVFSLPAPYTIPLTNCIAITDSLELDGTTQPGYTGQPVVVISRTSSTESLYFDDCASNLVKGIRFSDSGGGVLFLYGGDSRVENCWFVSNNVGIYLHNSPSNTIGGGADYRNVFLYCGTATYIDGTNSSGNSVSGNYIGLYPSGQVGGNRNGVEIFAGSENTIGGTGASMRNLFAGHQTAVYIAATNNVVIGNWIGLDPSGTGAAENTNSASYGIYISQGASNTIGGASADLRNVIVSNLSAGISINGTNATGNRVLGNYIGTGPSGTTALPNSAGIILDGASANFIGGTNAGEGNLICSSNSGLDINQGNSNTIYGNYIG